MSRDAISSESGTTRFLEEKHHCSPKKIIQMDLLTETIMNNFLDAFSVDYENISMCIFCFIIQND